MALYVLLGLVCGEVAQPGSCLAQGVSRLWAGVARVGVEELVEARHQECCCVVADLPEADDCAGGSGLEESCWEPGEFLRGVGDGVVP